MHEQDPLRADARRIVYACVDANPGAHLRDVARRCGMPLGTTLYHLDALDRAGLVTPRRDGRYKRYFIVASVGREEKAVLSQLRHETPRRIVLALLASPMRTQREMCATLGLSRSTLSFHASALVRDNLLVREPTRPEARYAVRDPALVRAILTRYRASLSLAGESALFDAIIPAHPAAPALEGVA